MGVYRFHDMDGDGKAGEKILDDPVAGGSDADRELQITFGSIRILGLSTAGLTSTLIRG
jgi:hypothetical protein